MVDEFDHYKTRKGLWFWMLLSIAEVISHEPKLSAKYTDNLVRDFVESEFFRSIFPEEEVNPYVRFIK